MLRLQSFFSMLLIYFFILPIFAQNNNHTFIWGVWYNSYQQPYVTFQKKYDAPMFIEHLDHFKKIGINRIYFLAKFPTGHTFYPSKIAPKHPQLDWDPLAFLVQECRTRQIQIFVYVNMLAEGEYNEETKEEDLIGPYLEKFPQHAMLRDDGKMYGWASPSIPEVVEYELSIVQEILENYAVDGIQFDRLRYPDIRADFNPSSIQQYKKLYQKEPNQEDYDWTIFRQEVLTQFIRQAKEKIRNISPHIIISGAVFPRPESAPINQLQAWGKWCREGLLDEVNPMSYYRTIELFQQYVRQELEVTPPNLPFLSGIGAFLITEPEIMEQQIVFALSQSVQGIVFFNGYHLLDPAKANIVERYAQK